jgi:hypothetical protein
MSDIFISYRRSETEMAAGRLCDQLKRLFGDNKVFIDTAGILPGVEFVDELAVRLGSCRVFLPVIGPHWAQIRTGIFPRISRPSDFVRLEVFAALNRDIKIVPVLVSGAQMPTAKTLPDSIARLSEFQAVRVSTDTFLDDVNNIASQIRFFLENTKAPSDNDIAVERVRIRDLLHDNLKQEKTALTRRGMITGAAFAIPSAALAYVGLHKPPNENQPQFAQPLADPCDFIEAHGDDSESYRLIQEKMENNSLAALPFKKSRGNTEPILTLAQALGNKGLKHYQDVSSDGKIVFHAVGCTGSPRNTAPMNSVGGQMASETNGAKALEPKPSFLLHLGDIIYSFGEEKYYVDQFYFPYRNYLAPIFAIPGNHDGLVIPGAESRTLESYFRHFCAEEFHAPIYGQYQIFRTPQIQPGAYFTLEAPYVRIMALYSNILEGPGVIAGGDVDNWQLSYLESALRRVKEESYPGAVIVAHHHPIYNGFLKEVWSPKLQQQLDDLCSKIGVWPHLVLSAHAHNYQRFTRKMNKPQAEIPYIICGNGGHGSVARINQPNGNDSRRTPYKFDFPNDDVTLETYDDQDYGYLRLTADSSTISVNYTTALKSSSCDSQIASNEKALQGPGDLVSVDLRSRRIVS